MYGGEGISFLGKSRGRVLSEGTQKQEDFLHRFRQGPRLNRKAVDWARNFEANVSWGGGGGLKGKNSGRDD